MFSINPFYAERQAGKGWSPCRVVGIEIGPDQMSPRYVVEYNAGGVTHLALEEFIRKNEPGNPL